MGHIIRSGVHHRYWALACDILLSVGRRWIKVKQGQGNTWTDNQRNCSKLWRLPSKKQKILEVLKMVRGSIGNILTGTWSRDSLKKPHCHGCGPVCKQGRVSAAFIDGCSQHYWAGQQEKRKQWSNPSAVPISLHLCHSWQQKTRCGVHITVAQMCSALCQQNGWSRGWWAWRLSGELCRVGIDPVQAPGRLCPLAGGASR